MGKNFPSNKLDILQRIHTFSLQGVALINNRGVIRLAEGLFANPSELTSVSLYNSVPNSAMTISDTVFQSSPNLRNLTIGGKHIKIENGLFDTL